MTIVAILLLFAATQADAVVAKAQTTLSVVAPEPRKPADKWRIDRDERVEDGKSRALDTTGTQCQVVGARMCTRKPRTVLKAEMP